MKTKILALLMAIVLSVSAMSLISCNKTPADTDNENDSTTDSAPESENTTTPETEPDTTEEENYETPVHNIIVGGKVQYSLIRADDMISTSIKEVAKIYDYLREAGDGFVNYTTDESIEYIQTGKHDEADYEIVVGVTNYENSKALRGKVNYGDYLIEAVGRKIYIIAWSEKTLGDAVQRFIGMLENSYDSATKNLSIKAEDLSEIATADSTLNDFPYYDGVLLTSVYDCGDNTDMLVLEDATKENFEAYLDKLEAEGYSEYDRNEMNENIYATYLKDDEILTLMFNPYFDEARVILESTKNTALYPIEDDYVKVCESMLIQIGVTPSIKNDAQNGMSYILRLEDGSFIVFDGGFVNGSNDDADVKRNNARHLYETIVEYTPAGQKPRIKMWCITHLHGDHHGAFRSFAANYGEKTVPVEYIVVNIPAESQLESAEINLNSEKNFWNSLESGFPSAKVIKAHAGQVMQFANVKMETIYSLELYAPKQLTYFNTSSLVCKLHIGDQTFMMTGDMSESANGIVCNLYGNYLQSDIVQVAHHGYEGGSTRFYTLVDPTWVLWPIGEGRIGTLSGHSRNEFFFWSKKIQRIFYATWDITVLNFPYNGENHTVRPIS